MRKLYIHENIVFCSKLVMYEVVVVDSLMNSWLLGVVVVMRCWCCEFMLWVFMIMKIVMKFKLFLRVLWKKGEFVICVEMMFLIQVSYGFECLFMSINVWINFGTNLGMENQKLGFWGKNGVFPESRVDDFCHNSPRERETS